MGYHLRSIKKGILGEPSKIREELEELEDALEQNNKIMAGCEAADILGALEFFVEKELNLTLQDLIQMHIATKRAFDSGERSG